MSDLSGSTTVVVGASRGLGHGIATAFAEAGAPVIALARTAPAHVGSPSTGFARRCSSRCNPAAG